jgi:hypothetical protein
MWRESKSWRDFTVPVRSTELQLMSLTMLMCPKSFKMCPKWLKRVHHKAHIPSNRACFYFLNALWKCSSTKCRKKSHITSWDRNHLQTKERLSYPGHWARVISRKAIKLRLEVIWEDLLRKIKAMWNSNNRQPKQLWVHIWGKKQGNHQRQGYFFKIIL